MSNRSRSISPDARYLEGKQFLEKFKPIINEEWKCELSQIERQGRMFVEYRMNFSVSENQYYVGAPEWVT